MSLHLSGCAYTYVPANSKGTTAVFYPDGEVGGYTETPEDSATYGAKVVILYGFTVLVTGAQLISLAKDDPMALVTSITPSAVGDVMFGEQGIEVRGPIKFSVPNTSAAELIVYWKKVA